jgi:hypothetical protein
MHVFDNETVEGRLRSLRMLCGIGPEGDKRDPNTPAELRQFCICLRSWLGRREEHLLSLSELGERVLKNRDCELDLCVVWDHLSRVAGETDYEPFRPGPCTRAQAAAALDRVIGWCYRQQNVPASTPGSEQNESTRPVVEGVSEENKLPGVSVDRRARIIRREGHDASIELSGAKVLWHIFITAWDALPKAYTLVELKRNYPGDDADDGNARNVATNRLRRELAKIGLTIKTRLLRLR